MFLELPSEIKRIIFKLNRIDYSSKSQKEIQNFSNRLKYRNVLEELGNSFKEYCYLNHTDSVNEIIENPINICEMVEVKW